MKQDSKLIGRRVNELGLAAAALLGIAFNERFDGQRRKELMAPLDELFGWTVRESDMAHDWLFHDGLSKEQIRDLAYRLIRLAQDYDGSDEHDSMIWMAGYDAFEIESLFDECLTLAGSQELKADGSFGEREAYDPVYDNTSASLRYFGRI